MYTIIICKITHCKCVWRSYLYDTTMPHEGMMRREFSLHEYYYTAYMMHAWIHHKVQSINKSSTNKCYSFISPFILSLKCHFFNYLELPWSVNHDLHQVFPSAHVLQQTTKLVQIAELTEAWADLLVALTKFEAYQVWLEGDSSNIMARQSTDPTSPHPYLPWKCGLCQLGWIFLLAISPSEACHHNHTLPPPQNQKNKKGSPFKLQSCCTKVLHKYPHLM